MPSEHPRTDAAVEPLWVPALAVCMLVSLAVFIAALFAARAGAEDAPLSKPEGACVQTQESGAPALACRR